MSVTAAPEPASGADASGRDRRSSADPGLAGRVRAICPYLGADGGEWRVAAGAREHHCTAVRPASPLSIDKQRRLCLGSEHETCATYLAAAARGHAAGGSPRAGIAAPDGTRWALTRTTPVVLDGAALRRSVRVGRARADSQLALGVLMLLALGAVFLARFSMPAAPAALLATASPAVTASPAATAGTSSAAGPTTPPSTAPTSTQTPLPATAPPVTAPPSPSASAVPASAAPGTSYRVRPGDTLYGIAIRFGTTVAALREANGLSDSRYIRIGQILTIP